MNLKLRFHKITHWEYWSVYSIYLPLFPVWLYCACKARTLLFFHGANPSIKYGGMAMESKKEIYDLIPENWIPKTVFASSEISFNEIASELKSQTINFPVIAKPNIGLKGLGVVEIKNTAELENYHQNNRYDFLIQEKINFTNEVGIFYHRFPDETKGKITGMVKKEFLSVKGNGKNSLKELVMENPRSAFQIKAIEQNLESEMQKIIPENEEILLIPFGSHTRGAKFIDISSEITEKLEQKIDEICIQTKGFYYGRLDVMYENMKLLKEGKNFKIIEINGSKSEPTHMYDPKHSLFFAWKEITRHWKIMAEISRKNHNKGFPYLDIKEGFLALKNNLAIEKRLRKVSSVD
ncbi:MULTISPECIES: D-alanine--D-alanine ligase [Chryseobacterium]|uniref:Carbamoyl phosphate synthase-like protein n=1 Tax=Chryseobacterium taihuense TaxID=1141221 RepID=A0A4U8WEA2_9FLAO|nr:MULTISPECIES: D-alanine--D-alanine ligase [Chryseobacterium]QQV02011.1 D-alanine--D-alanine ligase [Chryseobacterium sp. FDAARGOS 1104]VFB04761.1 carbamoyl phosphate synthase-like protein [Chryseobacterium taihuense]